MFLGRTGVTEDLDLALHVANLILQVTVLDLGTLNKMLQFNPPLHLLIQLRHVLLLPLSQYAILFLSLSKLHFLLLAFRFAFVSESFAVPVALVGHLVLVYSRFE